jgi:putative hemolysin
MVPRADIEWLESTDELHVALAQAWHSGHSWYPVCRGSLDHVVGVVHVPYLVELCADKVTRHELLRQHVTPAVFVPETLSGLELLAQFRVRAMRVVCVVDEYGEVQGMLTPLDLLEAITGELFSAETLDAWATLQPDGSWHVSGAMPVQELKSRLGLDALPEEDKGLYNTVAGLMQTLAGELLAKGEAVDWEGWHFEVLDLDGRRIDRVLIVRRLSPP